MGEGLIFFWNQALPHTSDMIIIHLYFLFFTTVSILCCKQNFQCYGYNPMLAILILFKNRPAITNLLFYHGYFRSPCMFKARWMTQNLSVMFWFIRIIWYGLFAFMLIYYFLQSYVETVAALMSDASTWTYTIAKLLSQFRKIHSYIIRFSDTGNFHVNKSRLIINNFSPLLHLESNFIMPFWEIFAPDLEIFSIRNHAFQLNLLDSENACPSKKNNFLAG